MLALSVLDSIKNKRWMRGIYHRTIKVHMNEYKEDFCVESIRYKNRRVFIFN